MRRTAGGVAGALLVALLFLGSGAAAPATLGTFETEAGFDWLCLTSPTATASSVAGPGPLGVIASALATAYSLAAGCQQTGSSLNLQATYTQWGTTQGTTFGNLANVTGASYQNLISVLNVSEVGWQRAADHAALLQLGNSTFSVPMDLVQGQIAQNFAPVIDGYAQQTASIANATLTAFDGNTVAGAAYAGVTPTLLVCSGSSSWTPSTSSISTTWEGVGTASSTTIDAYIQHGSPYWVSIGGNPVTIQDLLHPGSWYNFSTSVSTAKAWGGPSSLYAIGTPASDNFYVGQGELLPASSSGTVTAAADGTGYDYWTLAAGAETYTGASQGAANFACLQYKAGGSAVTAEWALIPGGSGLRAVGTNLPAWLGSLQWQAAINGEAYWAFLRSIGYTAASQIPANCIIPAPYMVLPSSINSANLNVQQWLSLYESALEGMGHFYNVSLSATSFCGTQATQQFSFGGAPWANLAINATGMVYLANASGPYDYKGKSLATEKFANASTWAIGNTSIQCTRNVSLGSAQCVGGTLVTGPQQLLLMPTLATVTIPLNVRWEVPTNNPIEIFAVQTGLTLWTTGNGTGTGTCSAGYNSVCTTGAIDRGLSDHKLVGTLSPGSAIFLTSCTIGGSATRNCTVTVQTVNVTVAQITCTGSCASGSPPVVFGGLPNPFTWLANLLGSLFGGGALGQFLGSLLSGVIIFLVIVALVYIAAKELEAWGRRKSSGAGSP